MIRIYAITDEREKKNRYFAGTHFIHNNNNDSDNDMNEDEFHFHKRTASTNSVAFEIMHALASIENPGNYKWRNK